MLSAALLTGCRTTSFWPRAIPECPGALRPPAEIPGDVRLELSMRVRAESVDTALRLALEKRGDEITLIGLNPLGAVVFSAIQTGAGVEIDALPAAVLEVPPKNVLRDLHRAFFIGIAPPPRDGEYREVQGDTRITERWDGGVLRRRSFERVSGRPSGEVVLDFAPAPAEGLAETRIQNGWCGYAATLVTLVESVPD